MKQAVLKTDVIKNRMKELNISAYRLAKDTGLSNTAVCYIVSGERTNPNVLTVKKIADALGLKVDDLL